MPAEGRHPQCLLHGQGPTLGTPQPDGGREAHSIHRTCARSWARHVGSTSGSLWVWGDWGSFYLGLRWLADT